jgi:hypothetical protein
MTFHNRRGLFPFLGKISLSSLSGRVLKLLIIALAATGFAVSLSLPGMNAWAWHQSPLSPVSPVTTQPDQVPTPSPTAPVITPTSTLEPTAYRDDQLFPGSEGDTGLLVAGGIVLTGLIAGVVVLLTRGQASDGSTP